MKKIIILQTIKMLIIIAVAYVANFMLNILLAHLLSIKDYGDFSVIKEIVWLASLTLLFGSNFSVLKFMPEYLMKEEWGFCRGYLTDQILLYLKAVFMLVFIAFLLFSVIHLFSFIPHLSLTLILFTLLLITFFSANLYLPELLRALKVIYWATFLSELAVPLFFAGMLIPFYFHAKHISLVVGLLLYSSVLFILFVFGGFIAAIKIPKNIFREKPQKNKSLWRKTSWQLMISKLVLTILFSSEIILLKIFGHGEKGVGIFAAILTISSLYWLIFNAVTYVISPLISPIMAENNFKKLQSLLDISTAILFFFVFCLFVFLTVFRIPILHHFGADFSQGSMPLIIVMIGFSITVILGVPWYFIGLSGNQHRLVKPVSIVAFSSIVSTAILSHYFDLNGAAISLSCTEIIMGLLLSWEMKKCLDLKILFVF